MNTTTIASENRVFRTYPLVLGVVGTASHSPLFLPFSYPSPLSTPPTASSSVRRVVSTPIVTLWFPPSLWLWLKQCLLNFYLIALIIHICITIRNHPTCELDRSEEWSGSTESSCCMRSPRWSDKIQQWKLMMMHMKMRCVCVCMCVRVESTMMMMMSCVAVWDYTIHVHSVTPVWCN
jgi:hypothetical protein